MRLVGDRSIGEVPIGARCLGRADRFSPRDSLTALFPLLDRAAPSWSSAHAVGTELLLSWGRGRISGRRGSCGQPSGRVPSRRVVDGIDEDAAFAHVGISDWSTTSNDGCFVPCLCGGRQQRT